MRNMATEGEPDPRFSIRKWKEDFWAVVRRGGTGLRNRVSARGAGGRAAASGVTDGRGKSCSGFPFGMRDSDTFGSLRSPLLGEDRKEGGSVSSRCDSRWRSGYSVSCARCNRGRRVASATRRPPGNAGGAAPSIAR